MVPAPRSSTAMYSWDGYRPVLESSHALSYSVLGSGAGAAEVRSQLNRVCLPGCTSAGGSSGAGNKLCGVGKACRAQGEVVSTRLAMPEHMSSAAQQTPAVVLLALHPPFWFQGSARWSCRDWRCQAQLFDEHRNSRILV